MPEVTIHNQTTKILNIAFSQVCPLYHSNEVGPSHHLTRNVGSVWFTIECKVDNGANRYSFAESAKSIALVCTASLSVAALAFSAALPTAIVGGSTLGAQAAFWAFQGATRLAPILWPAAIEQICKDHGISPETTGTIVTTVTSAAGAAIVYTTSQRETVMDPKEKEREEKILQQARNKFRAAVKALTAISGMEAIKRISNVDVPVVSDTHTISKSNSQPANLNSPSTGGANQGKEMMPKSNVYAGKEKGKETTSASNGYVGKEKRKELMTDEERRQMEIDEIKRRWKEVEEEALKDRKRKQQERMARGKEEMERRKKEKEEKLKEKIEMRRRQIESKSIASSTTSSPPPSRSPYITWSYAKSTRNIQTSSPPSVYSNPGYAESTSSILSSAWSTTNTNTTTTNTVTSSVKRQRTLFKLGGKAKTWKPSNPGYAHTSPHISLAQHNASQPSSATSSIIASSKPQNSYTEEISISVQDALDWAEFELSEINEAKVALGKSTVKSSLVSKPDPVLPPKEVPLKAVEEEDEEEDEKRFRAADIAAFASAFIAKTSVRMGFRKNVSQYPSAEQDHDIAQGVSSLRSAMPIKSISEVPDNAELRVYCVYMGWGKERSFSIRERGSVFILWDDMKDEEVS